MASGGKEEERQEDAGPAEDEGFTINKLTEQFEQVAHSTH